MRIFGFAGWSGSGKTTLIEQLIPRFVSRGLSVSLIKHAHHEFDIDRPGKDSYRHRSAGCTEVMVASGVRWALMHEMRDTPEEALEALLRRMAPVDLVLIEGWKLQPNPRMEVHRVANGKPLLHPDHDHIVAIASDMPVETMLPRFGIDDYDGIARFVLEWTGLR